MYAFGLEENGEYARAERMARRALALEPLHAGAVHVVAHVMEMQGRNQEGLAFLAANEEAWAEGTGFSVHLAWHRALFHLDANDPAAALAVYDEQIAKAEASGLPALADAFGFVVAAQAAQLRCRRKVAAVGRSLADKGARRRARVLHRSRDDGLCRCGSHCCRFAHARHAAAH